MDRIVIVKKKTSLDELIEQHMTYIAAKFYLKSLEQTIDPYEAEDKTYKAAVEMIRSKLPSDIQVTSVERQDLPNFLFRNSDLVIVCGPDGLFVNLAQYIEEQLVITVNPDPKTVTGALMLFRPDEVGEVVKNIQTGKHKSEALPFIKASLGIDKVLWGLNDILIGRKDPVSARYNISFNGRSENQSSSGILVSTGTGSTGWMKSIQAMVDGIIQQGRTHKLSYLPERTEKELVFVVREPFLLPNTGVSIVTDRIFPGKPLIVHSQMPTGGYIFSDGIVEKGLIWNAGETVTISVGDRFIHRIVR